MMFVSFDVCLLLVGLLCSVEVQAQDGVRPRVTLAQGEMEGSYQETLIGKKYEAFEGIPYAKPPVGKYRFREPQPPKSWRGVWDASRPGSECLQYDHFGDPSDRVHGDEDCLFLNVYRPLEASITGASLPVIIHIHGGAFMFSSGDGYGPRQLLDRNVIYINLNYRLGPLGFLSTEDEVVPGNMGLKDQTAALKWIKENVASFGGDPSRITLTGLSAGGASVHYHYLSPLSRGLFARGISLSGTGVAPWPMAEASLEKAKRLAVSVGCPVDDNREMIDCLKHRPARQLVRKVELFMVWLYNPFSPFGAVVEKSGPQPFLPAHPLDLMKAKLGQDIPWITTVTSEEGLYPGADYVLDDSLLPELEQRWSELASSVLDFNYTIPLSQHKSVAEKIKQHYLKGRPISKDTFAELIQMMGDRLFVVSSEQAARITANVNKSPVYFYRFSYRGTYSVSEFMSGRKDNYGASHGDDLGYVLTNQYIIANPRATPSDAKMTDILVDIWVKFAEDGIPPLIGGVKWLPVLPSAKQIRYLQISGPDDITMTSADELGHRSFWESIPFMENENVAARKDEL